MVMGLRIIVFDSSGMVHNLNSGRADLQIGYSTPTWNLLRIDCGDMFLGLMAMKGMSISMAMAMVMVMVRVTVMAMGMAMAIAMVLVIVIIVPEVLSQVDLLRQNEHQTFHILRAFY
jgi:hypothetical protein